LLQVSTPARVSTYAYVNPVVAVLLGWMILDEPLGLRTLIATGIIVTAVVVISNQRSRASKAVKLTAEPATDGKVMASTVIKR
jgi:drug/metabolite transporter (DMT)-like permease